MKRKDDLIEILKLQSEELKIQLTLENRLLLFKVISHCITNKVIMRRINEDEKSRLINFLGILLKSMNISN